MQQRLQLRGALQVGPLPRLLRDVMAVTLCSGALCDVQHYRPCFTSCNNDPQQIGPLPRLLRQRVAVQLRLLNGVSSPCQVDATQQGAAAAVLLLSKPSLCSTNCWMPSTQPTITQTCPVQLHGRQVIREAPSDLCFSRATISCEQSTTSIHPS